jgi:hypothetical protein
MALGPAIPVTTDEVIGWFTDAGFKTPAPMSVESEHFAAEVKIIVNMVNTLQKLLRLSPLDKKASAKVRLIQVSLNNLRKHLPWLLDQKLPEAAILSELKNTIDVLWTLPVRYLFPSRQGPKVRTGPSGPWEPHSNALVAAIERACGSAGRRRPSWCKEDSPFVKVVCRAFKAIDNKDCEQSTVASLLNRRRHPKKKACKVVSK